MACTVAAPWDQRLLGYDFGPGHPLAPVRVELTMALAEQLGALDLVDVTPGFEPASDDVLQLVHDRDYVEAVRRAGDCLRADPAHGLGTADNPVFAGMHQASALVAGASVAAAEAVANGTHDHGLNLSGGLHHAMVDQASGFCIYNDPAVAIAWLLARGVERVAYVDVDVHHGDGVQAIFWDDPRVLTISLHESGRTLFPGTGWPEETGGPAAMGTALNIAFEPGTTDEQWHRAFDDSVPAALRGFAPSFLVTQHGCDTHALDPLAHLLLTVDGQRSSYEKLHELAHEICDGRWLAVGGGGYELVQVVPRSWTHLIAIVAGSEIDPLTQTPLQWREYVKNRTGQTAPTRMTDTELR
jgi:acetoin utilization deacetylase AcuC-like enzyme